MTTSSLSIVIPVLTVPDSTEQQIAAAASAADAAQSTADDHIAATTSAHVATAIELAATESLEGDNVQEALEAAQTAADAAQSMADSAAFVASTAQTTANNAASAASSAASAASAAQSDADDAYAASVSNQTLITRRAPYLSVAEYSAVPDATSSFTGTDNVTPFTNAISAASALIGSTKARATLFIPSGQYRISQPISFPGNVDVISDGIAHFYYSGNDRSQPVITIGTAGTVRTYGIYEGIAVAAVGDVSLTAAESNAYAAVRIQNMSRSHFRFNSLFNCAIGIQLRPSGEAGMYCGHNSIRGNLIYGCKWGLDLRTNTNTGWVNENVFYDFDISGQGNLAWGSHASWRYSTETGGESLQNNNRFFGMSCQPQLYSYVTSTLPEVVLSGSQSVVTGRWYINNTLDPPRQYLCTQTGTTSAPPTHTSGADVANGTASMQDMGPYFRSPIFHDAAGLANFGYGNRHETGYGPTIMMKNGTEPAFSSRIKFAGRYEFYEEEIINVNNTRRRPTVDVNSFQPTDTGQHHFGFNVVTEQFREPSKFLLTDIADRAIGTATTLSIQGMHFNWYYDNVPTKDAIGTPFTNWNILRHGVYYALTGKQPSVFVDSISSSPSNVATRFKITKITSIGSPTGNLYVFPVSSRNFRVNAASNDLAAQLLKTNCDAYIGYSEATWYASESAGSIQVAKGTNTSVAKFNVGMLGYAHVLSGLVIEAYANSINSELRVNSYFEQSVRGDRSCYGTPTMGKFLKVGEVITNTNVSASQPIYWVVKVAGILNRAWPSSTGVVVGEYCINDTGKAYCCIGAGTTASSGGPTGTSTSISDGTAVWEYVGVQAQLVSSIDIVSGGGDY